jgi:hypothetical protein
MQHLQREWGNFSLAFEKVDSEWEQRDGTAELKPY